MSVERLSHVESKSTAMEDRLDDHGRRISNLEDAVITVRLGMSELHGDLKLNNQATEHIKRSVSSIEGDTKEMIAVYRASPRQREDVKWWAWMAGAAWAVVMAAATVYAAIAGRG